jgi:hypothetical protein
MHQHAARSTLEAIERPREGSRSARKSRRIYSSGLAGNAQEENMSNRLPPPMTDEDARPIATATRDEEPRGKVLAALELFGRLDEELRKNLQ